MRSIHSSLASSPMKVALVLPEFVEYVTASTAAHLCDTADAVASLSGFAAEVKLPTLGCAVLANVPRPFNAVGMYKASVAQALRGTLTRYASVATAPADVDSLWCWLLSAISADGAAGITSNSSTVVDELALMVQAHTPAGASRRDTPAAFLGGCAALSTLRNVFPWLSTEASVQASKVCSRVTSLLDHDDDVASHHVVAVS